MKPQEFFIGIRDFFAILVPGAFLLLLFPFDIADCINPQTLVSTSLLKQAPLPILVVAAYAVGVLLMGIAGRMDEFVDRNIHRRRVATGKPWIGKLGDYILDKA